MAMVLIYFVLRLCELQYNHIVNTEFSLTWKINFTFLSLQMNFLRFSETATTLNAFHKKLNKSVHHMVKILTAQPHVLDSQCLLTKSVAQSHLFIVSCVFIGSKQD